MDKLPFDIDVALERIEDAVRPWPKAALFQLFEEGTTSTFEQLLACIISLRTYDDELSRLSWEALDALISPSTFHEPLDITLTRTHWEIGINLDSVGLLFRLIWRWRRINHRDRLR